MRSVVMMSLLLCGVANAGPRDWASSATCGKCHPAELASWQTTRHAMTRDRFAEKPPAKCLGCHGTGEAPAGPAVVEVGCEACHGAGAAYATDDLMRNAFAAKALGLADLSTPKARTAVCMTCHSRMTKKLDLSAPVHPVAK
ncbi:MAG TPA: multiheme c-type cytochrome [Kofleriaceae bacterium]|nr:multiheme c-type cytochrome [Kofleriaceae bacterium]